MQMKEKVLNHEEMLNHYLIRGFMELAIFRVERQFPNEIRKADPWAFTIGSAFFENKFDGNFGEQINKVCQYIKGEKIT